MTAQLPKIFVLGSCVSRDMWSARGTDDVLRLAGYIARTSLASAFGTVAAPRSVASKAQLIESGFQRRMVLSDLNKQASKMLKSVEYDYILLDFIDERFDLVQFSGWPVDSFYTLSAEFRQACRIAGMRRISSGSAQHFNAWKKGLSSLIELVGLDRLILSRAYWASWSDQGLSLNDGWEVDAHNEYLSTLYAEAMKCGLTKFIEFPRDEVADSSHRWGLAPFHFQEGFYIHARNEILGIIAADRSGV